MKRALSVMALLLAANAAFAFDSARRAAGSTARIAVLRGESDVQQAVADALRRELRTRGLDAFDAERTYDELRDSNADLADFYVEITGGDASTEDYGGIGISGRHGDVELGVVVSRLAAELRVYDGNTMELLATQNLSKRSTAVLPTSVGIGGRALYAFIALPFIERAQHRSVARAAAREAATLVAATVRGE
jgi:hypothetical protein